jgi:glycosyltransferase involved in cell wall biosynthesis
MNLLFVVHRAYPYPGGSEAFVHWMAVECLRRGHQVGILADTNQGDQNGILITANRQITAMRAWDLIIVHGADCVTQDFIHREGPFNSDIPILYQIIQPSSSPAALQGMERAKFIGVSTIADKEQVYRYRYQAKIREVPHGVPETRIGKPGFKLRHGITNRMIMSAGGFWPHKGMQELTETFIRSGNKDSTLCLFGYARFELAPKESDRVRVFRNFEDADILDALSESDLYMMNSQVEGFGLVLLEAMLNKISWAAAPVGGARDLASRGQIIRSDSNDLLEIFQEPWNALKRIERENLRESNFDYVKKHHLIYNTIDGIEKVLEEL